MSIFISLIIFLSLFISPVLAQESPNPYTGEIKNRLREGIKEFKQNVKTEKTELKDLRNANKEDLEKRKKELKSEAEQRKEEFKSRMEEAKTKAKEQIEAKKVEMKEKLRLVRDEQKKNRVERLEKQLNELNERMTGHFIKVLDRLEKVLVNIESRTDKAEARGWDVSGVRAMITVAESAISETRLAIEAQSAKNYTPTISGNEEGLKSEVGQARQALHRDLGTVKEKIRLSYEAVRRVATTLAQVPKIDDDDDDVSPTVSPSLSPTP